MATIIAKLIVIICASQVTSCSVVERARLSRSSSDTGRKEGGKEKNFKNSVMGWLRNFDCQRKSNPQGIAMIKRPIESAGRATAARHRVRAIAGLLSAAAGSLCGLAL